MFLYVQYNEHILKMNSYMYFREFAKAFAGFKCKLLNTINNSNNIYLKSPVQLTTFSISYKM